MFEAQIAALKAYKNELFNGDFHNTWDHSLETLDAVLRVAEVFEDLFKNNLSTRLFDTGMAVSHFRDQSTRTRFAFAGAASLLGLSQHELEEKKSQIAHGETVRETANMISFLSEALGIRHDIYLGEGYTYMKEVAEALQEGFEEGVLPKRPAVINLQSDLDHPTQSLSDLLHLKKTFGSLENLKGKKVAMTWAYSPSYGKPLSVPQGSIGLFTRYGMDVSLAHPEGYELLPDIVQKAGEFAQASGGKFQQVASMEEAFKDADIVYPKSWAPYKVMEERTKLLRAGEHDKLDALEQDCLAQNAKFIDWECDEKKMALTKGGDALYMHCLPADISGVSCEKGEVSADTFEKYRIRTYHEASHKPYIIAAMIALCRFENPGAIIEGLVNQSKPRRGF